MESDPRDPVPCRLFFYFPTSAVVFVCFFLFLYFSLPTLFCRLSVAQEGKNIKTKEQNKDNPINQLSKKSDCWLSGYLPSEKMAEVRLTSIITLAKFYRINHTIFNGTICPLSISPNCINIILFQILSKLLDRLN